MRFFTNCVIVVCSFLYLNVANAQDLLPNGIKLIDYYLVNKNYKKADSVLNAHILNFKNRSELDSLSAYPYYVGKLSLLNGNIQDGIRDAELFTQTIINGNASAYAKCKASINLADFYDEVNENQKSLDITKKALTYALASKVSTPEDIGKVRYNIGVSYMNIGEIEKAKTYFMTGLQDYLSYKKTTSKGLSDANNAVGAVMWMSAKLDSAKYYYNNAIKAITSAKGDSINNTYLSTIIKSNISLLEHSQGKLSQAIKTQKSVIANYQIVIDHIVDENIRGKAKRYQLRAITNLATFYNESGDVFKANTIIDYALHKAKQIDDNSSDTGGIEIQLGQSELSLKNYDKALKYLTIGLKKISSISGGNTYWEAAAHHAMAEAFHAQNNVQEAKTHYDKAEVLFKASLGDNYDKEFLLFLNNKALFLARSNEQGQAIDISKTAYNYVSKHNDRDSFSILKHIKNLAEVYYISQDYTNAKKWAKAGSDFISQNIKNSTTAIDSVKLSFSKPNLLLIETKADYKLLEEKDPKQLLKLTQKLHEGLSILEQRKGLVINQEDINLLITDYKNVTDFSKKLHLNLYETTNNKVYLDKIIELHESSIYNRIRSRLNLKDTIAFANLPDTIVEKERVLKQRMSTFLDGSKGIDDFFEAQTNWSAFRDSLKISHPKYYKMRYATIEKSLDDLQSKIPNNTTVVRYVFIENELYAFVVNKTDKNLYKLESNNLSDKINVLGENQYNVSEMSALYHELYESLWQPFETSISTENVIIIPDGALFNLSFETLTPTPISAFKELATNSLLATYAISYNYSLLLLDEGKKAIEYKNDFIAFAPEFNAQMKQDYKIALTDSLLIDKTYLNLLPQPFSVDLAKEYSKLFNGDSFLNDKATKQVFTNEANEHKIIHIGTHAESNNISPELSRLIFAKNADHEDNSLYTYEIYNENLNAQLAILTACETGKPTYQSGEGMISLAHAFNYAGSESILTSLWKIDEQSSTKIVDLFLKSLKEGKTKDQALREAKLAYISSAQGRTVAPQYWAGLVIIGDATPINLDTSSNSVYAILGIFACIVFIVLYKKMKG